MRSKRIPDSHKPMTLVTINLPNEFLSVVDKILETGDYPSRSEILRIAARNQLKEDLKFSKFLHQQEDHTLCGSLL